MLFTFCVVDSLFLATPKSKRLALTLFRSVHKPVFLFSLFVRVVFLCVVGFSADLAKQWRKIRGGVSEVGKTDFSILLFVFCVVFLFFLFISLARARSARA